MQASAKSMTARAYPMNLDHHLGEIEIGELSAQASQDVTPESLVFDGHFPTAKILPGVVLVEYAMYVGRCYLEANDSTMQLTELKSASFIAPVFPGHKLKCACQFKHIEKAGKALLEMRAVLSRDGVECAKVRCLYGDRS